MTKSILKSAVQPDTSERAGIAIAKTIINGAELIYETKDAKRYLASVIKHLQHALGELK